MFYSKIAQVNRAPIEAGQTVIDEIDANNTLTARQQTVTGIKVDPDQTTIYGQWKGHLVMAFAMETTWYIYPHEIDVQAFLDAV